MKTTTNGGNWIGSVISEEDFKRQKETTRREQELLRASRFIDLKSVIWREIQKRLTDCVEVFNHTIGLSESLQIKDLGDCSLLILGNGRQFSLTVKLFDSSILSYWKSAYPDTKQSLTIHVDSEIAWKIKDNEDQWLARDLIDDAILRAFLTEYYQQICS